MMMPLALVLLFGSFSPLWSFEACLELCQSLPHLIEIRLGLRSWLCRWSLAQKLLHHVHRRQNGGLDLAQAALNRILHLLVSVKGRLQIPHDELLPNLIRGNDQLAKQLERQAGGLI